MKEICINLIFVLLSSVLSQQPPQVLDCNFDQQNFCRWTNALNGVEDDFDWRIDNTAPIDGFHSIPRTVTGTGFFAYAQGRFRPTETEAARAWLMSPVINGLANPAQVNFVFWKTAAPPVLQTCIRDSGDNRLRCFDTVSGLGDPKWVQKSVTIPSNSLPFQIVLVALGFRTALDLIGIDDLTVRYATGETLGRIIDGSGSGNLQAPYPQPVPGAVPPSGPPLYQQPGPIAVPPSGPPFYPRPLPGVIPSGGLQNLQPYPAGVNGQPIYPQPFPGPTLPNGQQPFYPQPFPGALGPSPGGQASYQPGDTRSSFPTGQIVNPPNVYATPGVQPPVEQTRQLPYTGAPLHPREVQSGLPGTQEHFSRTQEPFPRSQEPSGRTQEPFPRTQESFPRTQEPFPRTQETFPRTQELFPRSQEPLQRTPEPSYVFITQAPFITLPQPRPFTNPYYAQSPVERIVGNPNPPPPPPSEPNPIPSIERSPTGIPIIVNQETLKPTTAYYHMTGAEERVNSRSGEELGTTHDHRFYLTTSPSEGRRAYETTPRLAIKVDPAEAVSGQCSAVACPFNKDFCKWYNDLSSNFDWKLKYAPVPYQGAGYIFVSGDFRKFEQRASIRSPSFVVSTDSVLEFLAFISDADSGRLNVYIDDSNNPDNLLWKATGHKSLGGTGWRRIRVPLPASSYPTTLSLVCDQLTLGQFIGLDDVRLTDKAGFDIGCASDSAFPESTLTPRILSIQPIPPLAPETNIAKISEAPIRESAVFAKSRAPFVFVDPTSPVTTTNSPTTKFRQETTAETVRTTTRKSPSIVTRAKFVENNDQKNLENLHQLEGYGERVGYTSVENRLKNDQIVDYGWGTIKVNDFRSTLSPPGKKIRKSRNKTEAVDLKLLKDQYAEEFSSVKNVTPDYPIKKAVTPLADPLGFRDFVLQISRDLRDMFGQQSTQKLNLNSLYNYPIF